MVITDSGLWTADFDDNPRLRRLRQSRRVERMPIGNERYRQIFLVL